MTLERAHYLQDNLSGLIQVILIRVGDLIEKPLAANIIQAIIQIFKLAGKVTENGLIILNGLAVGCCEKIELQEICQYLKFALESKDNECSRSACGIISDLSNGQPE